MTDKPYPSEALTELCEFLLEFDLTPTQRVNLLADAPRECEAIEQDRNEKVWEEWNERGPSDDSYYRECMTDAGRGHLLK